MLNTGPITTRQIDLLLKGVRAEFTDVVDQAEKQLSAYSSNVYLDSTNKIAPLFEEKNVVGRQRAETVSVTGVSRLVPTEELQEFVQTSYVPSYITAVEPFKFTRRIKVSRESAERRDSMYQRALSEAAKLNVAAENTKAQHRFDRFNKAFSTVTAPHLFDYNDGVAAVASNHPNKISGVQTNLVTASDITPTSVESMVLTMQNWTDDIGEPMPMGGGSKFIVVPPAKVRKAKEVLESDWTVDTANNNVNVWKGQGWTLVTSPFLNAANGGSNTAWFVVDTMYSPLCDYMFRPVTNESWFDENTKAFVHDISMEHRVGVKDFRGLVGNQGA